MTIIEAVKFIAFLEIIALGVWILWSGIFLLIALWVVASDNDGD